MKKQSTKPSSSSTTRLQIMKDKKSFELTFLHNKFAENDKKTFTSEQTSTTTPLHSSSHSHNILSQKESRQPSPITPKPSIVKQIFILFTITPILTSIVTKSLTWFVTTSLANFLGLQVTQDQINMVIEKILDVLLQIKP
jgi:hypothetical protein